MKKMQIVCTPGYPMFQGTVACAPAEARLVKPSVGGATHTITPFGRKRANAAAALLAPIPVQTSDLPSDLSALTCERRT
ncbi:hypothetical protein [Actinophytocola xinjiangensis]|uniref:hypothetical protein n=1 Tax=Actinophytocola xinjiangensis TaxID=485602 RepID=UPI0012B83F30|nr:hypothetical protein [Actinophytocola xinjiangensis]